VAVPLNLESVIRGSGSEEGHIDQERQMALVMRSRRESSMISMIDASAG
jgi:hypothetical protein